MTTLVLGGTGFIGSHLVGRLEAPRVVGRAIDSDDFSDAGSAVSGCDVVYHLINRMPPDSRDARYGVWDLVSLVEILNACVDHEVKKVVFTSSGGTVYGQTGGFAVNESDPTDPISFYGVTKLAIEKYLHAYQVQFGLEYCILRIANAYGPGQTHGVIPRLFHCAMTGEAFELWGDGSVMRDYVYVDDVVDALIEARNQEGVFNIGTGVGVTILELIERIESLTRKPVNLNVSEGRKVDVAANVLDFSKALRTFRWAPKTLLADGLKKTYEQLCFR